MKNRISDSSIAKFVWFLMARDKSESFLFIPPVSIKTTEEPLTFPYCLSLVSPEKSATSAALDLVKVLKRADFPTFGRPTNATTGDIF